MTYTVGVEHQLQIIAFIFTYAQSLLLNAFAYPLLELTVADIATQGTNIEAEVLKWFDLAEAWNAVLLVDDTDIFFQQRDNRGLARNGLVTGKLHNVNFSLTIPKKLTPKISITTKDGALQQPDVPHDQSCRSDRRRNHIPRARGDQLSAISR